MDSSPKLQASWRDLQCTCTMNGSSSVSNLKMFKRLYDGRESVNRHLLRQDPLCLPPELVTHIFSYLRCDEILFVDFPFFFLVSNTDSYPNSVD